MKRHVGGGAVVPEFPSSPSFPNPLMQGAVLKPPFSFISSLSTHRVGESTLRRSLVLPLFKFRGIIIVSSRAPQKFKWGCSLSSPGLATGEPALWVLNQLWHQAGLGAWAGILCKSQGPLIACVIGVIDRGKKSLAGISTFPQDKAKLNLRDQSTHSRYSISVLFQCVCFCNLKTRVTTSWFRIFGVVFWQTCQN